MDFIADILLILSACAATAYCVVLSRRLRRFTDLEKGVGGAIAILSSQVDDMTKTLKSAQKSAIGSTDSLRKLTVRAEGAARRLELMVASMHDIPDPTTKNAASKEKDAGSESEALFLSSRNQIHESAE